MLSMNNLDLVLAEFNNRVTALERPVAQDRGGEIQSRILVYVR